jgi:membrane-associated protein
LDSFWDLFKPEEVIRYGGLAIIITIVLIENGIFFGFFLPGDSLLFTAGLLCYLDVLDVDLVALLAAISLAAVIGYYIGYYFGFKTGEALYRRPDTLFFKKQYIYTAEAFYKKYGGAALIMGRFLPIVRTFAPILAGVVKVDHKVFLIYNVVGALLWPGVVVTLGYYVGSVFPNALHYLDYIIITFIIVTAIPVYNNIRQQRKAKKQKQAEQASEDTKQ